MGDCTFTRTGDRITCPACGFSMPWTRDKLPRRNCQVAGPSLPRAAFNFATALVAHVANGLQQRSKPEIEALLAICQACPLYDGAKCTHRDCGCNVNGEERFWNKISWASEHCPISKW